MNISQVEFVSSVVEVSKCPKPMIPEYAFIGRSNVGKSSLINMLTIKKGLAKTSGTPGKTRTINHFVVNEAPKSWYIVDLPGYGYAKISQKARKAWELFIHSYMEKRENLMCTFVLIDSRLPLQKLDLEFMLWLGERGLPFALVFTKCDKLTKTELVNNFAAIETKILEYWNEMPNYFMTSADSRLGRDQILDFIEDANKQFTL